MGRLEKIQTLNSLLLKEAPEYRQQAAQFAEDAESQRRLLRRSAKQRFPQADMQGVLYEGRGLNRELLGNHL